MSAKAARGNPAVDAYFGRAKKWRQELERLRAILLGSALTEEFKWGKPCYTFQGHNVVIILSMKETCALLFTKGALLNDPDDFLVQPTENTQAARQMRFTSVREIAEREAAIQDYVEQAVQVEKEGRDVVYKKTSEFAVPLELESKMAGVPGLRTAFNALTPGRQRGYLLHFSAAKQSRTREARVEKWMPHIFSGKGMHDE